MTRKLGFFALLLSVTGCGELVSSDRAIQAVRDEGFTEVNVREQHGIAPRFYGCVRGDSVAFDVTATNVQHRRVNLTVCCGLILKGCTIRH